LGRYRGKAAARGDRGTWTAPGFAKARARAERGRQAGLGSDPPQPRVEGRKRPVLNASREIALAERLSSVQRSPTPGLAA